MLVEAATLAPLLNGAISMLIKHFFYSTSTGVRRLTISPALLFFGIDLCDAQEARFIFHLTDSVSTIRHLLRIDFTSQQGLSILDLDISEL